MGTTRASVRVEGFLLPQTGACRKAHGLEVGTQITMAVGSGFPADRDRSLHKA